MAQERRGRGPSEDEDSRFEVLPPSEPMGPREALFLAIELKDLEAARRALQDGGEAEISVGDPSPLATAALHNNLRMVLLLLEFGGDPSATSDSPLEEAVRHENTRMVEVLMRAGARVPDGPSGQEMFRLAQRGGRAQALSEILMNHDGSPDLCLAAAVEQERIEQIKTCMNRGAELDALPAGLNILSVALRAGEPELVDRVVLSEPGDAVVAGALEAAIEAGNEEVVRLAVSTGAVPTFAHIESAIESGQPAICRFLLEQTREEDATVFGQNDAAALVQRAEDLGYGDLASELRRRSGLSIWTWGKIALPALGGLAIVGLLFLLVRSLGGQPKSAPDAAVAGAPPRSPSRPRPPAAAPAASAAAPARVPGPAGARAPSLAEAAPAPGFAPPKAAAPPAHPVPSAPDPSSAATIRIDPGKLMDPAAAPAPHAVAAPAAPAGPPGSRQIAGQGWELVSEPVKEKPASSEPVGPVQVASEARPAFEMRMPQVDLSRDAEAVFDAARRAASGESVRPDAPDRRQIVLVTPARVAMLQSCPAPGSLSAADLAAAEGIAPSGVPKNIAAVAYNDLDALHDEAKRAIPFFDLLRQLGYLGHAVWIFEGHVSAMGPGCRDADVLIVDDGMMPYMPGNWRSVASGAMRGSAVFVYERKSGALRQLK